MLFCHALEMWHIELMEKGDEASHSSKTSQPVPDVSWLTLNKHMDQEASGKWNEAL